ncbi:MAG: ATP-binding cassette domain-containing protein [Candidatus Latescibacteria bacterium]|nr:ATP-binding cassette domain-containing protein [Candidatus Latescibacterota bacterium]
MGQLQVLFHDVSFSYETAVTPLLADLTLHFPRGWTGIVGANGAGKTTILQLASGHLAPRQGFVQAPPESIYCAQRTDQPADGLAALLAADDGAARDIKGRLALEEDWLQRWDTLSHGERKRAQIGVALWRRPEMLAIDEPTNHIDAEARQLLEGALRTFRGVGLLVSHDRQLLDRLCQQCLFVDPPGAQLRPGGVSEGTRQGAVERASAWRQKEQAQRQMAKLERETVRRRQESARSHQRRSKRGLGADNDARHKRNHARRTGKDGTDGKLLRQMDGRLQQARQNLAGIEVEKTYDMGIWIDGARSQRDALLTLSAGHLPLGKERRLTFPDLAMRPDDRIGITGPNGAGKSTLVRHLLARVNAPLERVIYLPQEIDAATGAEILQQTRALGRDALGRVMSAVSCLGSRPQRLLESARLSPGEIRKLMLALGIAHSPHLIVMDEPTNHLDLPSIECLEKALADCPCGLLLVSHDLRFLGQLAPTRWQLQHATGGNSELCVG